MNYKKIEYAYPLSQISLEFGCGKACYTVEIVNGSRTEVLAGFKTKREAEEFAEKMLEPWTKSIFFSP